MPFVSPVDDAVAADVLFGRAIVIGSDTGRSVNPGGGPRAFLPESEEVASDSLCVRDALLFTTLNNPSVKASLSMDSVYDLQFVWFVAACCPSQRFLRFKIPQFQGGSFQKTRAIHQSDTFYGACN